MLVYFRTECIKFEPRFRWTEFFAFFDNLELNYTLTYAPHGVRLPDNILLA